MRYGFVTDYDRPSVAKRASAAHVSAALVLPLAMAGLVEIGGYLRLLSASD
jgi:AmiR/NasT family two-component response regulator